VVKVKTQNKILAVQSPCRRYLGHRWDAVAGCMLELCYSGINTDSTEIHK